MKEYVAGLDDAQNWHIRMNTIGERIRFARERAKLSQSALGRMIGVRSQSVTQWESNGKMPGRHNVLKLAALLHTTTDWLLMGGNLPERNVAASFVSEGSSGRMVPMLSVEAAIAGQRRDDAPLHVTFAAVSEAAYFVQIMDDSNGSAYPVGARAVFDPAVAPRPGDMVLAAVGDDLRPLIGQLSIEATAKGKVLTVKPLNDLWPAARSDQEQITICAPMIEITRSLR